MLRILAGALAALALTACGGSPPAAVSTAPAPVESRPSPAEAAAARTEEQSAALWVTRERGAEIVLVATVPAGTSVLGALESAADVETAYGGRFVTAVNGIEGGLSSQEDWFYFLNGIEGDVGAAEVTLDSGDVAWWDFRSWGETMRQPVVVGAFPEPFLNGWDGGRRPVRVQAPPELAAEAARLEALLGASRSGEGRPHTFVLEIEEGAEGAQLSATRGEASGAPVTFELVGSVEAVRAAARALAVDPAVVRFRYVARFDDEGRVIG